MIGKALDAYFVYKFVRILTTPWNKLDAFKQGIVDANGKIDKTKSKGLSIFDRLVFNIKRLMGKIPGGKSRVGTYAAALWLLKESHINEPDAQEQFMTEVNKLFDVSLHESDRDLIPNGTKITFSGYVCTESFDTVNEYGRGRIVSEATSTDPFGGRVYIVEVKGQPNVAVSELSVTEEESANVSGNIETPVGRLRVNEPGSGKVSYIKQSVLRAWAKKSKKDKK